MPSNSKTKFDTLLLRAESFCAVAGSLKKKSDSQTKSLLLHAALASQVAAWEVYIKGIGAEYFSAVTKPTDPSYSALHDLLISRMKAASQKLNTPNSGKCREFLMMFSGFDPWPSWTGVKFETTVFTNALLTRNRLDEIFDLRHSFAHGYTMPAHSWNTNSAGSAHLDCKIVRACGRFFSDISSRTDKALAQHIAMQHLIAAPW